jgi:hypothetical protein
MELLKNYTKLVLIAGLFLSISSCKKDGETPVTGVAINLPSSIALTYGEQQDIDLPADLLSAADVQVRLDFKETNNLQVSSTSKLHDKLGQAITFDKKTGKLHVNSTALYPNNAVSSLTETKLPESYKITVIVSSSEKAFEGKQTVELKIAPAKLSIKGLDNQAAVPFAYVLYGDPANFDLEASSAITEGAIWNVENKASIGTDITVKSNQLQFPANAGDPNKKAEKAYDVIPVLQKDGFSVASRTFRVVFIPKIKFFYGAYYSDLDLTILLNNLHIALSNGYISSAPTLYPEEYKSGFAILSIVKDGKAIENTDGIFDINSQTGSVTVKKNSVLTQGAYVITVKATTTTGLEFNTTLTLNMSKAD